MTNDPTDDVGTGSSPATPAHAPTGYGASAATQGEPAPPTAFDAASTDTGSTDARSTDTASTDAAPPGGPVYGRVHRYGPPAASSAGTPTGTGPDAGPPGAAAPGAGGWTSPQPSAFPPPPPGVPTPPVAGPGAGGWAVPPGTNAAPFPPDHYASWLRRAVGSVVDDVPGWVASVIVILGYVPAYRGLFRGDLRAQPSWALLVTGSLLSVAALGWTVYNRWFLAGRTGQSLGRRLTGTWLVDRSTGRPVGMLFAFVRDLLHVLDRPGLIGYLWPLWDPERQTLADKIALTVVIRTPVPPLLPGEPLRRV